MNPISPIPSHQSDSAELPSPRWGEGQGEVLPGSALRVPSSALVRAQLSVETTVDASDPDLLHIRASDETLDRYKEVIAASGWRLENYSRNPVIQNAHQYGDIIFTIGRAEKTWVSGNTLLQTWRFASNENPFAKIARDLYRGKFLQAASVGFVPLKWEDGTEKTAFTRRYTEQELIEVSAVGIPANPNALTMALQKGAIEKSDVRQLYDLLKHLVAANVSSREATPSPRRGEGRGEVPSYSSDQSYSVSSMHSVVKQPAFELLARQLHDLANIFKKPLTTNRKETQ